MAEQNKDGEEKMEIENSDADKDEQQSKINFNDNINLKENILESPFYKELSSKLTHQGSNVVSCNAPRNIRCNHCSFQASTYYKLKRHLKFRHFIVVDTDYSLYCPVRRCTYWCGEAADLCRHLELVHHGQFKIKTVKIENESDDETESNDGSKGSQACKWKGCQWSTFSSKAMKEHLRSHRSMAQGSRKYVQADKLELVYCDDPGCDYTCVTAKSLKIHKWRKHTKKNDQMQASKSTSEDGALILNSAPDAGVGSTEDGAGITNTTGEVASPTTAEKQRSKRIKTTKRRYYDEEWISVKRKKARLESLNMSSEHQYASSICSKRQNSSEVSVPPAEVTSLPQATPTVSNPASPDPRNISNDADKSAQKKMRLTLKPFLINFDPVQKALIAMSKAHGLLNERLSKIDGVMEKLIQEHGSNCTVCQSSSEVMSSRAKMSPPKEASELDRMKKRIEYLEGELKKSKNAFQKMTNSKVDGMTYAALLDGVSRPKLYKENDFRMVQGYRMVDLNVMRMAMKTAQQCRHAALILTEVNAGCAQVDLATQLGLLCTFCGQQTIFNNSSFSDEAPSNYAINKLFLPMMGPVAYYSLVGLMQRSTANVKVSMNFQRNGYSVPPKAKLLVSIDREKYTLDATASEPADEIIQPDITGDYENIAEPDFCDEDTGKEQCVAGDENRSQWLAQDGKHDGQVASPEISVGLTKSDRKSSELADLDHAYGRRNDSSVHLNLDLKNESEITSGSKCEPNLGISFETDSVASEKVEDLSLVHVKEEAPLESQDFDPDGDADRGIQIHSVQGSVSAQDDENPPGVHIMEEVKMEDPLLQEPKTTLKIKSFDELKGSGIKEGTSNHCWTTVDENSRGSKGILSDYGEIYPVEPGTNISTSDVTYSTEDESNLPIGVYRVGASTDQKKSVLIVKNGSGQMQAIQKRSSTSLLGLQVNMEGATQGGKAPSVNSDQVKFGVEGSKTVTVSKTYKSALQLFSMDFTRRLRQKMHGTLLMSQEQINKIAIEKWTKMSEEERMPYKRGFESAPVSSCEPEASLRVGERESKISLPPGWNRRFIQQRTDNNVKRLSVVIQTPTGERLKTKGELFEYMRLKNISGISPDIFKLPKAVLTSLRQVPTSTAASTVTPKQPGFLRLEPRLPNNAIKDGVINEIITGSNGMKMLRVTVTKKDGTKRETMVPAIAGENGQLKVALPRSLNLKLGSRLATDSATDGSSSSSMSSQQP